MKLLEVKDLAKNYFIQKGFSGALVVKALRGVSFDLSEKETLAVVGESGCGKSTLAKVLMKIEAATEGQAVIADKNLSTISQKDLPKNLQMVFQDPYSSLNPRKKIKDSIAEPLVIRGDVPAEEIRKKVLEVTGLVGLRPEMLERYPHMMSGGQRQRVGIARALVTEPQVIICDEPVSALDVSVQAQVLNLLLDLQEKRGVSYIFISHDLQVVRFVAHRIAVMYLGKIVELASRDELFKNPRHPYTQLLLESSPKLEFKDWSKLENTGDLPSPTNPPPGCAFHTRCPLATDICKQQVPQLRNDQQSSGVFACHHPIAPKN